MRFDPFRSCFGKELQALFEAVKERCGTRAAFPRKGSWLERLLAIFEIPRRFDTNPADERRSDAFTGTIGQVNVAASLRGTEPLVTRTTRGIDKLRRQIKRHRSEALNDIDTEQRIHGTSRAADSFEIGPIARRELHAADRDNLCVGVYKRDKFVQIDTAVELRTEPEFDTMIVPDTPPCVKIGRKLTLEADDIIARLPFNAIRDRGKSIRCIANKGHLIAPHLEHSG